MSGRNDPSPTATEQEPRVYDALRAHELRGLGLSQTRIASILGCSRAKVQALLAQSPPSPPGKHSPAERALSIEAGMAYTTRYGELPTSVLWNATKAYARSAEAWRRYLTGWVSERDTETWRKWPHPSGIARAFAGGMPELQQAVQHQLAARSKEGAPYVAMSIPSERVAMAGFQALCRQDAGPRRQDLLDPRLQASEVDVEPAPGAALHPLAVVKTEGGPAVTPSCKERQHLGVPGKAGSGKTSILWRIAFNDVLHASAQVVVLERGEATVTMMVEQALRSPLIDDFSLLGSPEMPPLTAVTDDAVTRGRVLNLIDQVARGGQAPPISVICDDGQDILPLLVDLLKRSPSRLYLTIAWTPQGIEDDVVLLKLCQSLCVLAQDSWTMATAISDELNQRHQTSGAA
jgi:hypothetical protein